MQRQHSSQATSTLGNTLNLHIGSCTGKRYRGLGVRKEVQTVIRPPPFGNWDQEPKISSKPEARSLITIKLIYFLH